MYTLKLKNIEGIRQIIESLHRTKDFNQLRYIITQYNDSEMIEILITLKNKKDIEKLMFIVTGINAGLKTHTSIYTDGNIILE